MTAADMPIIPGITAVATRAVQLIMEEAILPTTMAEATLHNITPVDITGDPTQITTHIHQIITDRIGVRGNTVSPIQAIRTLTVPIIGPAVIISILITIPQGMVMIVPDTGWILMATMWTAADGTPEAGAIMKSIMTS